MNKPQPKEREEYRAPKLTRWEIQMLRDLDATCFVDSETGGGGWATIKEVAEEAQVTRPWVQERFTNFRARGLVERQERRGVAYRYALTELGAELLENS